MATGRLSPNPLALTVSAVMPSCTSVGAGALGFFTDHGGVRADLRYLRSFVDPEEDNEFDVSVGKFDYWRAMAGLTFRW